MSTLPLSVDRSLTSGSAPSWSERSARLLLATTLFGSVLAFGSVPDWAWAAMSVLAFPTLLLSWRTLARQDIDNLVLYAPPIAMVLFGLLQVVLNISADKAATLESVSCLTTYVVISLAASQLIGRQRELVQQFAVGIAVFTLLFSLFAIIQFFSDPHQIYWTMKPRWGGDIFGSYVNRNDYAGLMEMLLGVTAGLALSEAHRTFRAWLVFAIILGVASVFLSGARAGTLIVGVELVLFLAYLFLSSAMSLRRVVVAGLVLIAAVALFSWMDTGYVRRRLETIVGIGERFDVSDRVEFNKAALRLARRYPLAGTGLGTFEDVSGAYLSKPIPALADHAHDDYAEVLAETGLIGGLLVLSWVVLFVRVCWRNFRRESGDDVPVRVGAFIGCCGLLLHGFVDFNFRIPANALWFAVIAGFAATRARKRQNRSMIGEKPRDGVVRQC